MRTPIRFYWSFLDRQYYAIPRHDPNGIGPDAPAWRERIAKAKRDIENHRYSCEVSRRVALLTDEDVAEAWRLIDQWAA